MPQMLRTDTGNFNRFLTSLGLALLAAAIVIPYFFFRDTGVLSFSRSELNAMTNVGREALLRRQHRIAWAELPVLGLSVALLLAGCASIFFGGKRLRKAQTKEDAAVDRQAEREAYEISKQSASEVAEGQETQAMEEAVAKAVEERLSREQRPQSLGTRADSTDTERLPRAEGRTTPVQPGQLARSRSEIATHEESAQIALGESIFAEYEFFSEISITTGLTRKRRIRLDGLFEARLPGRPSIALELKVVSDPGPFLTSRLRTYCDQLLAHVSRYTDITENDARGWLLIVISKEVNDVDRADWVQAQSDVDDLLGGLGRCTILAVSEIGNAPDRFRQLFES